MRIILSSINPSYGYFLSITGVWLLYRMITVALNSFAGKFLLHSNYMNAVLSAPRKLKGVCTAKVELKMFWAF